ncbi:MAG TPA: hypothetical protein VI195_08755, partial [Steroidobacteraceae bacterium]
MTLAPARGFLDWPFFEARHRELATRIQDWAATELAGSPHPESQAAVDARCRELVGMLGAAGLASFAVPQTHGGGANAFDVRALALIRETLAW